MLISWALFDHLSRDESLSQNHSNPFPIHPPPICASVKGQLREKRTKKKLRGLLRTPSADDVTSKRAHKHGTARERTTKAGTERQQALPELLLPPSEDSRWVPHLCCEGISGSDKSCAGLSRQQTVANPTSSSKTSQSQSRRTVGHGSPSEASRRQITTRTFRGEPVSPVFIYHDHPNHPIARQINGVDNFICTNQGTC